MKIKSFAIIISALVIGALAVSSQAMPATSSLLPSQLPSTILAPDFSPFVPVNPSLQGTRQEVPRLVISSVRTPFGIYDPSTYAPIKAIPADPVRFALSTDRNKLTNDEVVTIFYIRPEDRNADPSHWQSYFVQYLNVAYNRATYLFETADGKVVRSDSGKVKIGVQYSRAKVLLDMGLYRNIKYQGADRKVGYFFRTQVTLDLSNATVLDVSDLFTIAVSARNGVIQGSIETMASGLSGRALSKFLVPLLSLNTDSIQRAITSVAILSNKVAENSPDVFINPELYPEDM